MKNRPKTNILIDIGLLLAMAAVSISGFVMNVIIPSRHAIRHSGVHAYAFATLQAWSGHDWGAIHTWAAWHCCCC